ncbi:MAG: chromosomal replication initiator protein DnaA [Solirubrobacterales bacterium]
MTYDPPADDPEAIWGRVRDDLRRSLPPSTYQLWIRPLRAVSAQGSTLYLSAPANVRAWVERRYAGRLGAAVTRQAAELTAVGFVETGAPATALGSGAPRSLPIDPRHTFDRFVIGAGNRLAHAAALAVAESPGEAYNPLFLHGPPGLGKTHLLGAIAAYMRRQHPSLSVHYTTAERFTTEFVAALRHHGPEAFKARYRELDALLIDDVQILEGKQRTEEEFVHTFNALHAAGKQIVLSSDRTPEALSRLATRLRDRFSWGLRVELEPPDLRTRLALLWRLASDASPARELPEPAVLREIAARAPENIRVLEGAMTRVLAFASLLSEPLSASLVRQALGGERKLKAAGPREAPSLEAIQDAICAAHGLSRSDLLSSRRTSRVARARQLAMYLTRELTPLTLTQIAQAFDRDHSTVIHALRAVDGRLEPGSETAAIIHKIRADLGTTNCRRPNSDDSADRHPADQQR